MKTITVLTCAAWPVIAVAIILSGCSSVEPWQKGNLAKAHMSFEPDPLESHYVKKVYPAKEASFGGYGVGGGGCGCN